MTVYNSPANKTRLAKLGFLHYLEKPFTIKVLQDNVLGLLHNRNKGYLSSFKLPNFLQTIEMDQKTLTLKIVSNNEFGYLHFDNGNLIDAETGNLIGMGAAFEILGWDEAEIKIQDLATKERRIQASLIKILLEASKANDESKKNDSGTDQLLNDAVALAEGRHFKEAQNKLAKFVYYNPRNYMGWVWYSRVVCNLKNIKTALKNARLIAPNHPEVIVETEKIDIAGDLVAAGQILRCPFCWCPMDMKNHKCRYCQTYRLFNEQLFTSAKTTNNKILTQAVKKYVKVTARENNPSAQFYLSMAYLNLGQWEKGLDQLHKTVELAQNKTFYYNQLQKLMNHLALSQSSFEMENTGIEDEATIASENLVGLKKRKILVVEDSPTTRKIITITLSQNGFETIEARDGLEALSRLNETSPDLILLDIILPKMDGYKVLSFIKDSSEYKDIPVIMLTSKDSFMNKAKGRFSGSAAYITKPFDPENLVKTIVNHL
ncbi:MAG: response regulator [Deltaproteobacteria bacterium]|nr:response regulator [Deltaproteobacteria bacterium]